MRIIKNAVLPFFLVALAFTIVSHTIISVKRLHDLNKTGWLHIVVICASVTVTYILLPALCVILGDVLQISEEKHGYLGFVPIYILIWSVQIIVYGCIKGTDGSNKYGDESLK